MTDFDQIYLNLVNQEKDEIKNFDRENDIIDQLLKKNNTDELPRFCRITIISSEFIIPLWYALKNPKLFSELKFDILGIDILKIIEHGNFDLYKILVKITDCFDIIIFEEIIKAAKVNNIKKVHNLCNIGRRFFYKISDLNLPLEMLIVLHKYKIFDECSLFKENINENILIYFIENDLLNKQNKDIIINCIGNCNNLKILKLLDKYNFEYPYTKFISCYSHMKKYNLEIVQFLITKGYIFSIRIIIKSIKYSYEITKIMLQNYTFDELPIARCYQEELLRVCTQDQIQDFVDMGIISR